MSRIYTNDRKVHPTKLVPEPARPHRAGLEANALGPRRVFAQQGGQGARIRLRISFENYLTRFADHAHRGFLLGDVQADVLLHGSPSNQLRELDDSGHLVPQAPVAITSSCPNLTVRIACAGRSQKHHLTWDRMRKLADDWLPAPRILYS
jgi:hypothetical protein